MDLMALVKQVLFMLCVVLLIGCTKELLTENKAFEHIRSLPEVTELSKALRSSNLGTQLIIRHEPSHRAFADEYFVYYVGEKHASHTVLKHRFAVHKKSRTVFALDPLSGDLVPSAEWRQQKL